MSEKEKMQTEELAKIMDDAKPLGKSALSFMAGFVQGYRWFKRRPGENQNGRSALAQCSGKRGADRNDGQPVGGSDAPCDMAAGRAGCAGYFGEKA